MFCQWAISTVLLVTSRLRQSRVSTACFSVVTEYIKTIALFLLGAGLLLRGFSVSYWAALFRLRQWRHSFPSIFILWLGELSPPPPHFPNSFMHLYFLLFLFSYFYSVSRVLAVQRLHACLMSTSYERFCARRPYIRRFAMAKSGGLRLRPPTEYSISWRKPVEHNLPLGFGDTSPASCASTCPLCSCFVLHIFNLSKVLVKMY